MRTPVQALLWEQWRRTRWALLAVLGVSTLATLHFTSSELFPTAIQAREGVSLVVRNIGVLMYLLLLFVSVEGADDRSGLSRFVMTLPSRTFTLGMTRLAYGVITTVLLSCAVEGIAEVSWNTGMWIAPVMFAGLAVGAYAAFWTIGTFFPRVTMIVVTLLDAWVICVILFLMPALSAARIGLLVWLMVCGIVIALWGLELDRCGAWSSLWRGLKDHPLLRFLWKEWTLGSIITPLGPRLRAQVRYEWKRTYRWVPILTLAILCAGPVFFYLVVIVFNSVRPGAGDAEHWWLFMSCFLAPLVACGIIGMLRAVWERKERDAGLNTFALVRPVATRELATARLLAGARGVLAAYAIVLVLVLVLVLGAYLIFATFSDLHNYASYRRFTREPMSLFVPHWSTIFGALCAHMLASWMLLWFGGFLVFVPALAAAGLPQGFFALVICLTGGGTLVAMPLALRKGLVSQRALFSYVLAWPAVAWCLAQWPGFSHEGLPRDWDLAFQQLFFLLLSLAPFLPLAVVPLMLHRARHR